MPQIKHWKKRKFEAGWNPPLQPQWKNVKTGEQVHLFFSPKEVFFSKKHPVGIYDVFIYNKEKTERKAPFSRGTKKQALKNAVKYMMEN